MRAAEAAAEKKYRGIFIIPFGEGIAVLIKKLVHV